eukprot:241112-Amphidinium_carterae.1
MSPSTTDKFHGENQYHKKNGAWTCRLVRSFSKGAASSYGRLGKVGMQKVQRKTDKIALEADEDGTPLTRQIGLDL